jgi:hypothetical protein
LPEIVQEIGAAAGIAAVVGLAVLSALYFSQARDVKRLREWAGRAPERSETGAPAVPGRAAGAQPAVQAQPQAARPAATGGPPAVPGARPATTPAAAAATGAGPATAQQSRPGVPVPATAAAAAAAGAAGAAGASAAGAKADGADQDEAKPDGAGAKPDAADAKPDGTDAKSPAAAPAGAPAGAAAGAAAAPASAQAGAGAASAPPAGSPSASPASPSTPRPATPGGASSPATPAGGSGPATPGGASGSATPAGASGPPPVAPPPVRRTPPPQRPISRTPSSRGVPQETAIIPPRRSQPWYSRIGGRYIAIILAGLLVVGGGAAYGITQLTGDDGGDGGDNASNAQANNNDGSANQPKQKGAAVKPGNVTVAVLNGTTVPGLAATLSDQVSAAGFKVGTITNFYDQQLAESVVQYAPGHQAEAKAVGRRVGITQREPVSASSRALAGDATVVLIAGADKAP